MDWFSWLSKTSLEPSLVYEYGLAFAQNELEEEDIIYLNHEFLQSMGISIAKHRLEILKIARKDKGKSSPHPVARLMLAIKRTKKCFANSIRTLVRRQESSSAIVLVPSPRPSSGGLGTRWKSALMKRKMMPPKKQERLFLTNGSPTVLPALEGYSSPVVYHFQKEEKMDLGDVDNDDDGYWSAAVEEIKWDTMFQDLKPN
ncbi:uncharacterized protein LOC107459782 [Arachis duranensis]|uniref:Uncharacterized protein LOC107459782 n=1 Tax=Arachis duranensis TaxID=130453 RepID=A0A6P4BPL8_ARADU|nr:uncharacterized protein LOC107459782 [Arachis duranensis]